MASHSEDIFSGVPVFNAAELQGRRQVHTSSSGAQRHSLPELVPLDHRSGDGHPEALDGVKQCDVHSVEDEAIGSTSLTLGELQRQHHLGLQFLNDKVDATSHKVDDNINRLSDRLDMMFAKITAAITPIVNASLPILPNANIEKGSTSLSPIKISSSSSSSSNTLSKKSSRGCDSHKSSSKKSHVAKSMSSTSSSSTTSKSSNCTARPYVHAEVAPVRYRRPTVDYPPPEPIAETCVSDVYQLPLITPRQVAGVAPAAATEQAAKFLRVHKEITPMKVQPPERHILDWLDNLDSLMSMMVLNNADRISVLLNLVQQDESRRHLLQACQSCKKYNDIVNHWLAALFPFSWYTHEVYQAMHTPTTFNDINELTNEVIKLERRWREAASRRACLADTTLGLSFWKMVLLEKLPRSLHIEMQPIMDMEQKSLHEFCSQVKRRLHLFQPNVSKDLSPVLYETEVGDVYAVKRTFNRAFSNENPLLPGSKRPTPNPNFNEVADQSQSRLTLRRRPQFRPNIIGVDQVPPSDNREVEIVADSSTSSPHSPPLPRRYSDTIADRRTPGESVASGWSRNRQQFNANKRRQWTRSNRPVCSRCNKAGHKESECYALKLGVTCHKCGVKNHVAAACRSTARGLRVDVTTQKLDTVQQLEYQLADIQQKLDAAKASKSKSSKRAVSSSSN